MPIYRVVGTIYQYGVNGIIINITHNLVYGKCTRKI